MSWIQNLVETYDNCQAIIGEGDNEVPLLPIFHTTQKAQIEIVIDGEGNFLRSKVISKENARTIIPCTEKSGGRTSGEAPHPLCDKLQYIAQDYEDYGGIKKAYNESFLENLKNWCYSEFTNPKIIAIYNYLKKGSVIQDLVSHGILCVDENKKLINEANKNEKQNQPEIFNVLSKQEDAFIRWVVEIPGHLESRVWKDVDLWNSWINYYATFKSEESLCYYFWGEYKNQLKIILQNLGMMEIRLRLFQQMMNRGSLIEVVFLSGEQAATIGLISSQKAHFALRWLINKQGYRKGDQAIVAWATNGKEIPSPTDDLISVLGMDDFPEEGVLSAYTAQDLAIKFRKRIAGYGNEFDNATDIVVLALDSATTGRASITFYRQLSGSEFLNRIDDWHGSCSWIHSYRSIVVSDSSTGKTKRIYIPFIGAPAPADIAEALYGVRIDDKLRNATINRILPCIIDGQQIPRDFVESAIRSASNRSGKEYWEWNKTLTIACALFKKYYRKENFSMALDQERNTRDYLYGRLLALAESLEDWALQESNEKRETNAARLMQRFSERPYTTWQTIELSLSPYKSKLGGKSKKRQRMIDEVISKFETEDFLNDKKLSGEFLLGYHCQREFLRNQSVQNNLEKEEEDLENID